MRDRRFELVALTTPTATPVYSRPRSHAGSPLELLGLSSSTAGGASSGNGEGTIDMVRKVFSIEIDALHHGVGVM